MLKLISLFLLLSILYVSSNNTSPLTTEIHFDQTGGMQSINMKSNDKLFVTFNGLLSTGYWWLLNTTSSTGIGAVVSFDSKSKQEVPPDNWMFNFTAIATTSNKCQLNFYYCHPWAASLPPVATATLQVCVDC